MTEPKFENLAAVLGDYARDLQELYKGRLEMDGKKASGNLISHVQSFVAYQGKEYSVFLDLEPYWKYVEYGSKPHFPPVDKILEWVKIKPVLPRPMTLKDTHNGKTRTRTIKPTPKQVAFLISRKIAKEGIKAGNQLQEVVDSLNKAYYPLIEQALKQDTNKYCVEIFSEITKSLKVIG